jgi:3-deoxy-manno-octulosonate cytidylyltransferase (CMP-KDO synthetase)
LIEDVPRDQDYFARERVEAEHARSPLEVFAHIGTYAYRREFLLHFAALPQTRFEQAERLEQLRALEHGHEIAAPSVAHPALAVDTPADVERVEAALEALERS